MSLLAEVIAQLRQGIASLHTGHSHVARADTLVAEAIADLTHILRGSNQPEAHHMIAALTEVRAILARSSAHARLAEHHTHAYLTNIGIDTMTWTPPDVGQGRPGSPAPRPLITPVNRAAAEIFEPAGKPLGQPGTSSDIRLVDATELRQIWMRIRAIYGPGVVTETDKGSREVIETAGGRFQYRSHSKSGGHTIDVFIDGIRTTKIHILERSEDGKG